MYEPRKNLTIFLYYCFRKRLFGRSLSQRRFHRLSESIDREYSNREMDGEFIDPHILTEEEIMNKYWKLMVRIYRIFSYFGQILLKCKDECKMFTKYLSPLQTSTTSISHAFQRWLSLTASAVIFWTSVLICRWLTTDPTLSGILSFIFPILIIPILASIYAEVNYECSNVLKVICTFHSCNVSPYSNIF